MDTDVTRGECYDIETILSRKPTAVKKNSTPLAKWPISPDRAIPWPLYLQSNISSENIALTYMIYLDVFQLKTLLS